MKVIRSLGGPFIGLHRSDMPLWSGNDGKTFIGQSSPSPSDYEAGGLLTDGRRYSPCNTAKIVGETSVGLLISLPFEIAIVEAEGGHVYLAQVHYGPEDWTLSSVNRNDFDVNEGRFRDYINFTSSGGEFVSLTQFVRALKSPKSA